MTFTVDIPRDERAPATARDAIRQVDAHLDPDVVPDMTLLVSELVTNSVKYGGDGVVRLEIDVRGRTQVRVEVVDQGGGFIPVARSKPKTDVGGWGLHLVEQLTTRWGVHAGSTHVWFEIDRAHGASA
jgi:anti-sigma regulatory factor (Ser/Thr protein kinase)